MNMKNNIQAVYPQSVFCSSTAPKLYIADFSERTNSDRKVEFHETMPKAQDNTTDMDCLVFENFSQLSVVCNNFSLPVPNLQTGSVFPFSVVYS